jgi:uncharacterized protein YbcI
VLFEYEDDTNIKLESIFGWKIMKLLCYISWSTIITVKIFQLASQTRGEDDGKIATEHCKILHGAFEVSNYKA